MAVTKRLRFEILRRDNHTCRYCGSSAPDVKLTVDHVVPVALGGSDEATNLVTACAGCNSGKSATSPDAEIVADVAEKAAVYATHHRNAMDEWRARQAEISAAQKAFDDAWQQWTSGTPDARVHVPRDSDWATSIERWVIAGFTGNDLVGLIDQAMTKPGVASDRVWKFYCGIVWGHLRNIQEEAARGADG